MQFQTQILLLSFSCKGVMEEHHSQKRAYLLFVGIYKLHVELQFLSQFLKCSRPVLMLPVPVLNGLAQPLENKKKFALTLKATTTLKYSYIFTLHST